MSLFDLKVINSVLGELEEDRGIPRAKVISAIEMSLAAAYKKEYGKRGQIIRAQFNLDSGEVEFKQIKIAVDDTLVYEEAILAEGEEAPERAEDDERTRFNPEHHIMIDDARRIKKDTKLDEEIEFPLEAHDDFGRIAAQTAKQVIMQKIREAEKISIIEEFGEREGQVVSGHVQRFERGNLFVDLGRATGMLPYEEQIPGERYRQGERIRALLFKVEDNPRGTFLKLSRSHPDFLRKLFELESPELANGTIEISEIAREAGSRSKLAVLTHDDHIDPVGSLVGQRGVRVSTVTSELGGEKIDIVEWTDDRIERIERALSPAETISVDITEVENEDGEKQERALVEVAEDQLSLAIGRGGQNVRLASKLTNIGIDIHSEEAEQNKAKADEVDREAGEGPLGKEEAAEAGTDEAANTENEENTPAEEVVTENAPAEDAPSQDSETSDDTDAPTNDEHEPVEESSDDDTPEGEEQEEEKEEK